MAAIEDEISGKAVGTLFFGRHAMRTVSLLAGKYQGTFPTHEECCAFAKGVEVVLNQMVQSTE
jgi:hypothetical protein